MQNPEKTAEASSGFAQLPATATHSALSLEYQWLNTELTDAPLAVFLHEGLGSIAMWRDWPQQLCDQLGMRGLVYSRPGYGRSTPRPRAEKWQPDYMHRQAHEVLPELLDALGVDAAQRARMWLIGHSDGGSITLLYAAAFPDALAGAVVIAPHVFVEGISVEGIAQTRLAYEQTEEQAQLRERLSRYHADVDSAFYGWHDAWTSAAFATWNLVDALPTIRCPLLAVQGYDDHYGTMAHLDAIARQVPHTQLVKLDACGHSPHRDAPAALNEAIKDFIDAARRQS
jgi:pimeloyl-ACP methyl ester carboxylesterase